MPLLKRAAGYPLKIAVAACCMAAGGHAQVDRPNYFAGQDFVPDSSRQTADRIVESKVPVVVDCWAPWCGPCRILNPVLEKLERDYRGRVLFVKVNIDHNRSLASYLGVQGIPAVFIVKDKEVKRLLVGVRPEDDYRAAIGEVLAKPKTAPPAQGTAKTKDTPATDKSGPVTSKSP